MNTSDIFIEIVFRDYKRQSQKKTPTTTTFEKSTSSMASKSKQDKAKSKTDGGATDAIGSSFLAELNYSQKRRESTALGEIPPSLLNEQPVRYTRTPDKGRFVPGLAPEIKAWTAVCRFRREMQLKYKDKDQYIPAELRYERKTYWKNELAYRVQHNKFAFDEESVMDENAVMASNNMDMLSYDGSDMVSGILSHGSSTIPDIVPLAPIVSLQQFQNVLAAARHTDGYSCVLQCALNSRHNRFIEILLQSPGTNVNRWIDVRHRTMLHHAVQSTYMHRIQYLLSQGADINAVDVDNQTMLHMALTPHSLEHLLHQKVMCRYLIDHGVNLDVQDSRGDTVLHKAVDVGDFDLIEMLLSHKARVSLLDNRGRVALERSSKRNQKRVLAMMVSHGTRDDIQLLWAHLLSRQFIKSVFMFHQPSCVTCKRKMKDCARLKVENRRQWMHVHGTFRVENKCIDDVEKRKKAKEAEDEIAAALNAGSGELSQIDEKPKIIKFVAGTASEKSFVPF